MATSEGFQDRDMDRAFAHGEDNDGLPVPLQATDWLSVFTNRLKGYVPVFADRSQPNSQFEADKHRKYFGKYYFQTKKKEERGGENSFKPMDDAKRSDESREAYFEFLEGLQQINQQEYLDRFHTGFDWEIAAKNRIKLGKPDEADYKAMHRMEALAKWEREIRVRSNAYQTQLFHDQLRNRAEQGVYQEKGPPRQEKHPPPQRAIRKETFQQLTRPLEKDFTFMGALTYVVSIVISLFTLYSQIRVLVLVCPIGFMCPSKSRTAGYPVLAPPVEFRVGGNDTSVAATRAYRDRYQPWTATLQPLCSLREDANCDRPGYLIQWPYVQTTDNGTASFPEGLKASCRQFEGGEEGWVYDHHTASLIREYWRCEDKKRLPFLSNYTTSSGQKGVSEFHYEPEVYEMIHDRTKQCMSEAISAYDVANWTQVLATAQSSVTEVADNLRSCMTRGDPWPQMQRCACGLNSWDSFAAGLFYEPMLSIRIPQDNYTYVCGSESGRRRCDPALQDSDVADVAQAAQENQKASTTDALLGFFGRGGGGAWSLRCPAGEQCVRKYPQEVALARSENFGCWFTSPQATERIAADYHACSGVYDYAGNSEDKYVGMTIEERQRQELLDTQFSKRTVLLLFFLIKEGCIVTGCVVYACLTTVIATLIGVIYLLLLLPLTTIKPDLRFTVNSTMLAVKTIIAAQLYVLFEMCISLSSFYRSTVKISQVCHLLVNPSIRDMDDKIAAVANTVYSLAVLLVLDNGSQSGILASLVLTLMQLIYQMTIEKVKLRKVMMPLRDLNENRLSKFEVALLWVKIMEDFLPDDVQYNWVQVFKSEDRLKPFDVDYPVTLQMPGEDVHRIERMGEAKTLFLSNPVDWVFEQLFGEELILYKTLTKRLDSKLEELFGHDGERGYGDQDNAAQAASHQTVEWAAYNERGAAAGGMRKRKVGFKGEGTERQLFDKAWGEKHALKRPSESFLQCDMFAFKDYEEARRRAPSAARKDARAQADAAKAPQPTGAGVLEGEGRGAEEEARGGEGSQAQQVSDVVLTVDEDHRAQLPHLGERPPDMGVGNRWEGVLGQDPEETPTWQGPVAVTPTGGYDGAAVEERVEAAQRRASDESGIVALPQKLESEGAGSAPWGAGGSGWGGEAAASPSPQPRSDHLVLRSEEGLA